MTIIQVGKEVEVGCSTTVRLIFRAGKSGRERLRCFVAVHGKPIVYLLHCLEVCDVISCDAQLTGNGNNPSLRCIVSAAAGIEASVVGIFNGNGHFIKTTLPEGEVPINEKLSFVGFSGVEQDRQVEAWQKKLMGKGVISVLLKVSNISRPIQCNVSLEAKRLPYDLKLNLPGQISAKIGDRITCGLKFGGTQRLLVQPGGFEFLDASGKKELAGLRWVGVVRKEICEENGYECEFTCRVFAYGVYQLKGIIVWEPLDAKCVTIEMPQMIAVRPS
jgi:hypothetical protein